MSGGQDGAGGGSLKQGLATLGAGEIHTLVSAEELARTFDEAPAEVDLRAYAPEDWVAFALFWAMGLAVILQFVTRYVLNDSLAWTEEVASFLLVALVFVGSIMCVRLRRHIQVDFLYRLVPPRVGRVLALGVDLARIGLLAYGARLVWRFMSLVQGEELTTVQFPKEVFYGAVFVAFVLMTLRAIQTAVQDWRRGYSVLERPEGFDAPPVQQA